MSDENLKPREELRNSFYEHYKTLTEEKNGVLVFYFIKNEKHEYNMETFHIKPNLSEEQFYTNLNGLEKNLNFACYVGEKDKLVIDYLNKMAMIDDINVKFAVYEIEPAHGNKINGVILGPFKTQEDAEQARQKYGYTSDNYYVDILTDEQFR